jgi:hypothetical protein
MGEAKRKRAVAKVVTSEGICLGLNRPTTEGWALGKALAEMADDGEPTTRLAFPAHKPRCKSCAFTSGTLPNGCPETVLDAVGCIVEEIPFMCHQYFDDDGNSSDFCAGWLFAKDSEIARIFKTMFGGKLPFALPARGPAAQAFIEETRRVRMARKK